MFFDFLDDVFLLDFSFETPQSVFDGFTILNSNFRQLVHPQSGCNRPTIITYFDGYGDVSIVFGARRKTLLPGKRCRRFVPSVAEQSGRSKSIARRPVRI